MPIRQNILRKGKAPKQNLLQFDVLQEESGVLGDLTTSRFFKISEFPAVLPTGNSSFLIEGSNLLKPEVEIKTELLDADGNPIFHYAIPNYDKELPARRIAIEIYDDEVVNGVGSFTVLGELNPTEFDIPSDFQDTYNVRFTAPVSINKKIKNTQPIRFYGDPQITVSEIVKGVIEKVPTGDSTQKTITGSVEFINTTPQTEFSVDVNSTTGNSNQLEEVGNSLASYINQNQGSAQSSILPQTSIPKKPFAFVVKEMEKGIDNALNKITSAMKGGTLSITRPDNLVDNTIYPDSKFDKPQSFETKILDVINSTTFTTTTQYTITNKSNNNKIVVPLNPSSSQTSIIHNVVSSTETEDQVFKRSFANMVVGNLRTFSGDTYKAKIYMKEDGTSGEFEKIYETLVESPNELVNKNSISGFENIGIFFTQSLIENNWVSASNNSTTPSASVDDDVIIDGVLLSGSNAGVGNSFTFVTKTNLELEKNEDYIVEFNAAFKKASKTQSDGTSKQQAELEVFITGSLESETVREISLGTIDLPDTTNTDFTIIQQKQITDFRTHNESSTPTGSLGFRVNSGQFILSDIRLRPFTQTNFSPGFFKSNVPMPKPIKRGKTYDFMVEFYDANNNLAETVALADNVSFEGPPQVIVGSDNILTGSMFLGVETGSGIEVHGGSAFIKSVGYSGFESSSASGVGGFLMFSGSVSESLGTSESYDGVGLELVSGSNRFLRFRTTPSIFEVVTDTFFLGSGSTASTGSFISGSNGNVEISSSNFHLSKDGDVTMAGEITAEVGGTIGGFSINETNLSATNFVLDTSKQSLTLGSGDSIIIMSASQGLSLGDALHGDSPFRVDLSGNVVATAATITGELTTNASSVLQAGNLAGFTLGSSDFALGGSGTTKHIKLDSSNKAISIADQTFGNTGIQLEYNSGTPRAFIGKSNGGFFKFDGTQLFVSSSEFILGTSASNAAGGATGIGAYISSSNSNLRVSSSGFDLNSVGNVGTLNIADGKMTFDGSTLAIDGTVTIGGTAGSNFATNTSNKTGGQVAGFTISGTEIKSGTNISINSSTKAISLNNATFGEDGVQLQYNSGTPRAFVGKKLGGFFKFDGSDLEVSSSAFILGNTTSFVSGSQGNIKISGSSVDIQTPAFVLGDLDSSFVSGSNGNLSLGATTFNLVATSSDAGILMDSARSRIEVTGSNSITAGNSVLLDGDAGVIQVSQSGTGSFDTGRTEQFERFVTVEPPVFKPRTIVQENISASLFETDPVANIGNAVVSQSFKTKFLELDKYIHKAAGVSNTPFYYQDTAGAARLNPNARLTGGGNPTSSVFMGVSRNVTAVDTTGSLFGPEFVFSADYFTDSNIETRGLFGFVSSSATGSNIFTINTRMSRSVADQDVNIGDAKFNLLGLETDLSGLAAARQNEYTFLQAKHSQSIRLQIQNDGDVVSKGNLTAFGTSFLSVSDEREKEHIYQISESLNKISDLRPTKFTWKETQKQDVGFIAQEVEKIIPEVVEETKGFINTDEDMNRKTISYPKLIPYLVDTIQELIQRIEKLEKKVK